MDKYQIQGDSIDIKMEILDTRRLNRYNKGDIRYKETQDTIMEVLDTRRLNRYNNEDTRYKEAQQIQKWRYQI